MCANKVDCCAALPYKKSGTEGTCNAAPPLTTNDVRIVMAPNPNALITHRAQVTRGGWCTPWTAQKSAVNFLFGVDCGELTFCANDFANESGEINPGAEGFVYFIAIGKPYVTHVKIGFTAGDPFKRLASLQTGCPFPMHLMGIVLGRKSDERELHDVLRDDRSHGEWFVFSDYVAAVIDGVLSEDISE